MRLSAAIAWFVGVLFFGATATRAADAPAAHAEARVVKAAYIYSFTKFVERRGAAD